MSIGEDLAQARERAGLTVTEVSERTRIRATIIRAIEHDDYSGCGGDFYARSDVRAIARAVGTDPGPLIRDYDAAHGSPLAANTAAEIFQPVTPVRLAERPRINWTLALGLALVAVLGLAAYLFIPASGSSRGTSGAAPGIHRVGNTPGRAHASASVPAAATGQLVVRLTAVQDCWVEFTTPGGSYLFQSYVHAGSSKTWTFRRAVDMKLGNPSGVQLAVNGNNPLPPGAINPITLRLQAPATTG